MQFRLNHSRFVENGLGARTYYPGGSIEAERMMNSSTYRFGQNTQEADMEISGTWGTHYTAEFWEYDARLMRRWLTRSGRDLGDDGRSDDNAYIVERVTKEYPDLTSFLNGKLNAKYNETYRGWYDGSSPLRKQRAKGQIQLHSTACYGTTIFWDVITK